MSQIDSILRVELTIWLSISSQCDSNILQLLGIPARIFDSDWTFTSKWLFSFSVIYFVLWRLIKCIWEQKYESIIINRFSLLICWKQSCPSKTLLLQSKNYYITGRANVIFCAVKAIAKFLSKIKGIFLIQCQYHGYSTHSEISFILDRNLAKANCTENHVCTSCDIVVLVAVI